MWSSNSVFGVTAPDGPQKVGSDCPQPPDIIATSICHEKYQNKSHKKLP